MNYEHLVVFRVVHVACGVFWAGAAVYLALFVLPAVTAMGPEGGRFMQQLAKTNRLPIVMMVIPIITILSGLFLIWKISGGLNKDWVMSTHGMILIFGAVCGLCGFSVGFIINRPAVERIRQISLDVAKAGGIPNEHQSAEIKILQTRMALGTRLVAWLLPLAVIAMSTAHYV